MRKKIMLALACACLFLMTGSPAPAAEAPTSYVPDPDPDRPSPHVQPPALSPPFGKPEARAGATWGSVNGISFIDVMTASGFDIGGADYGKEPSLAVNPLNPSQIVLTSFSGSNWGSPSSGNSSLFYSGDGGGTWNYALAVPPPTGTSTNRNCPCDQTMDWGRDGVLYGTFLWVSSGGLVQSVYSAQATAPTTPASWVYRTVAGPAQTTNSDTYTFVDQPWLMSGPLPGDNSRTNVAVAYDNFDPLAYTCEIRAADSPAFDPLDFTRDVATNVDGQQYTDGMNLGNRIAVGPTGLIFNLFERYVGSLSGGVKQLTYLVTVSADGGQTWSVANSDHPSGAKVVAANVYSFQGDGSKVGGVNALLGGVTAISVDPSTGTAWIVYGRRLTPGSRDSLFLVPVTYSAGSLNVGTAQPIPPPPGSSYLPAVAVLPSGEVGVLFLTLNGSLFTYNFIQTTDGGASITKTTTLASFTSPFLDNGVSDQRILGDYLQVKAVGCEFFGTFAARGDGVNSVNSIDPYFMRAPASADCALPTPGGFGLSPNAVCAGGPGPVVWVRGSNFSEGTTGRAGGALRYTTFVAPSEVDVALQAGDIASAGIVPIDVVGPVPGGILSGSLPLTVETLPASPGSSLRVNKGGSSVSLDWSACSGTTVYRVKRCTASGPCTPEAVAAPPTNSYSEATLNDGNSYWYLVGADNTCGEVL